MPRGSDAAVSDMAGTLLMVGAVVLAGGALTAIVSSNLGQSADAPPAASLSLASVAPGAEHLALTLVYGEPLDPAALAVNLQRGDAPAQEVPRASWSLPDPARWQPGERLTFPLAPPAAPEETLRVTVLMTASNAQLALLTTSTSASPATWPALAGVTLVAHLTPSALVADGVSAARLTALVTHPAGAGAIARVEADLWDLSNASQSADSTLALGDAGRHGDAVGGDGNWSGLLRPPALTPPGLYNVTLRATDLAGRVAATATVQLNVTGNLSLGGGGGSGNVTGGRCYGCVVTGGTAAYEGTRLAAPTSENITLFRVQNWTWDKLAPAKLRDDALVFRIVNSSAAWSMYFRFDYLDSKPCITYVRAWTATNQTVYAPRNGTCLPLTNLSFNVLDPVGENQLVRTSGNAHPHSLYPSAGLRDHTTFILAYLRDEDPTGQDELSQEMGVFSMDVVMA